MTSLQLLLLGALDIRSGGRKLPKPPTLKSQSLLAYLALHRDQPQPRAAPCPPPCGTSAAACPTNRSS